MRRNTRNWKHTSKNPYQWGEKRNTERYDTPFMCLDEKDAKDSEKEEN